MNKLVFIRISTLHFAKGNTMFRKSVLVVLAILMVVSFGFIFSVSVHLIFGRSDNVEASPVMKLAGEYLEHGFRLEATDENTVIVTVLPKEPRRYIMALTAAVDKVENDSGKKALQIKTCGIPSTVYLHLGERFPENK